MHGSALTAIQPDRKPEDVFPTTYRMNTKRDLRAAFGAGMELFITRGASEPGYHLGRPFVYRIVRWMNKHLPNALQPTLFVYARKK